MVWISALFLAVPGTAKDEIIMTLKDKVIKNLSSSGLTLAFHIGVRNVDSRDWEITRYRYRVTIQQREYLNMDIAADEPLRVPAGEEVLIALPVKVTYSLLFEVTGPVEDKALCDVVGDFFFQNPRRREERASFAFSGEFPIFKDPQIEFLPAKVNSLTLGGADVIFCPKFRNIVNYDLLVDRIAYRLVLGEKEVLSGEIPGDKTVPRLGEKVFELPFIIDFFDIGRDTRNLFDQGRLPFRFSGEIEIASVWGRLTIGFDASENIPFEKHL